MPGSMARTQEQRIARLIRRATTDPQLRHQRAAEIATTIQEVIRRSTGAQHPHRELLHYMALRYRVVAQDLIAQHGYGLLRAFHLYQDAIRVVNGLRHLELPGPPTPDRLVDWHLDEQSIGEQLAQTSQHRIMHYLAAVTRRPVQDTSILDVTRQHTAQIAMLLYDDFMTENVRRIRYIEFTIDAGETLPIIPDPHPT